MQMCMIGERIRANNFHLIIGKWNVHEQSEISECVARQLMNMAIFEAYRP